MNKRQPKIITLTASISRQAGGLFTSVRRLSQTILSIGYDIQVLALKDKFSNEDIDVWHPLTPQVSAVKGLKTFGYSSELLTKIKKENPSLIHLHGIWMYPALLAGKMVKYNNTKLVISPRGMLDPWALQNSAWKKKLLGMLYANRTLNSATCINALCESEYNSIRAYGLSNPVAIIPNGIDLPKIEMNSTRRKKKIHQVLFMSRIHPKKGLPSLIKAWKNLLDRGNNSLDKWQLLIAGWDQDGHENEIRQICQDIDLKYDVCKQANRPIESDAPIIFIGPKFSDEKDRLLRQVDAFILPSFSEGLPMAILEAWAYRLPVLMTPECNIPEGFNAKAAILLKISIEGIVNGLQELTAMSADELDNMGQRGRTLVEERFTWTQIAKQMSEVYHWCLHGGAVPETIKLD